MKTTRLYHGDLCANELSQNAGSITTKPSGIESRNGLSVKSKTVF